MTRPTTFWTRLFDHPLALRLQTRRVRRPLAVVLIALVAAHPIYFLLSDSSAAAEAVAIAFAFLVLITGVSIRGLTDIRDTRLDERQLMLKERAFRLAFFPAILAALAGGLFYQPALSLDPSLAVVHLALMVSLAMVMPAITLAWILPDEALDEEED